MLIYYLLQPVRQWLESLEIRNSETARWLCQIIPAGCPFKRTIRIWNYQIDIPPLCKLNPFYEQLVELRFKSLVYLDQECSEECPCP